MSNGTYSHCRTISKRIVWFREFTMYPSGKTAPISTHWTRIAATPFMYRITEIFVVKQGISHSHGTNGVISEIIFIG